MNNAELTNKECDWTFMRIILIKTAVGLTVGAHMEIVISVTTR